MAKSVRFFRQALDNKVVLDRWDIERMFIFSSRISGKIKKGEENSLVRLYANLQHCVHGTHLGFWVIVY